MNRFAIAVVLGFAALSVQAQSEPAPAPAPATAAAGTGSADTIVVRGDASARPVPDAGCIRESGTLLRKRDKKGCTGAPGQSYSREQIDRTGAIDTGEAIRRLSPSASLRRGG